MRRCDCIKIDVIRSGRIAIIKIKLLALGLNIYNHVLVGCVIESMQLF